MSKVMETSQSILLGKTFKNAPSIIDGGVGKDINYSDLKVQVEDDLVKANYGHVMTIAPAGSDKSNCLIIPNLLNYSGSVIVVDPSGDYYTATAEKRRSIGQKVIRLDPFGVIPGAETDSINPGDLISLSSPTLAEDCQMLVNDVFSFPVASEEYWDRISVSFTSALIGYICSVPEKKSLVRELIKTLLIDDTVYNLAVVLDTIGGKIPPFVYSEISSFLQKSDIDRSRILSTSYSYLQPFSSGAVLKSLDDSKVPIDEVILENAFSIYLIVPATKLHIHFRLLHVWIETLVACIVRKQKPDFLRTLVILDECVEIGKIPSLATSIPIWQRHNMLLWTFWQDFEQANNLYSRSWTDTPTVIQLLATKNFQTATEFSNFLGIPPDEIMSLLEDEQIIRRNGNFQKIKNL